MAEGAQVALEYGILETNAAKVVATNERERIGKKFVTKTELTVKWQHSPLCAYKFTC